MPELPALGTTAKIDKVSALPAEYPGWMLERRGGARRKQLAEGKR